MKLTLAIGSVVALTACASYATNRTLPGEPASEIEKDAALTVIVACVKDAFPRLNDQTSSADVVGRAIASTCWREFDSLQAINIRGMDYDFVDGFLESYDPVAISTSLVLQIRAT